MNNEDKEQARDSLKDLMAQADDSNRNLPIETGDDLPARIEHEPLDYVQVKSSAEKRGQKLMKSLLKLYLSQEVIENNEYIKMKAAIDQMTLASLMFQMQTAEHALTTLLRTIDSGELHPRMFEVLGGLQKTMLDIMKHQTLHLHAMEEGAKKLKHDIDIYKTIEVESTSTKSEKTDSSNDNNLKRGSRAMMRELQQEIQDTDFNEEDDELEDK